MSAAEDRPATAREALERIAAAVDDASPARIRESWQAPGYVIQLATDEWDDIAAAVIEARTALAVLGEETTREEWRICGEEGHAGPWQSGRPTAAYRAWLGDRGNEFWLERRTVTTGPIERIEIDD